MNLTTLSPAQIDELWAPIAARKQEAVARLIQARVALGNAERLLERHEAGQQRYASWDVSRAERTVEQSPKEIDRQQTVIDAKHAEEAPFRAEWDRRNGWTRAYLVITNGQGHVHRTTSCSTCYATTQFSWITEFSGLTEQEIVDAAGERACTVCYASAPVELRLDRSTRIFSEDEKRKQAERAEREQKRAAAKAAEIVVEGYREFGRTKSRTFKTVRALTNQIASDLSTLCWYGPANFQEELSNVALLRQALADRGIDYDYDKALASARKKAVRDGGEAKF